MESFIPAINFDHSSTQYPLTGKHQAVECLKCHPATTKNGKPFREFAGVRFTSCVNCHTDAHQDKFGQNCSECHTTESFYNIQRMTGFDHSRTGFRLENKHAGLKCTSCHKQSLAAPVKHEKCTDCHEDYHEGEFLRQGVIMSCADCHTTKGFTEAAFTVEQHNTGAFPLKGAHLATPCFICHKKTGKWKFREIGIRCSDCHENIHGANISPEYYPGSSCESCHAESRWNSISFDHSRTKFPLTGKHQEQTCRTCHFRKTPEGSESQRFAGLPSHCTGCHQDIHFRQFDVDGTTECIRCHTTGLWKIREFDHNTKTAFKLEGKHAEIACTDCHKPAQRGSDIFILYKIGDSRCEHCH